MTVSNKINVFIWFIVGCATWHGLIQSHQFNNLANIDNSDINHFYSENISGIVNKLDHSKIDDEYHNI